MSEDKMNKLLNFPYDGFLMIRYEFMILAGDELEAKLMRIIEGEMDNARKQIYRDKLNTMPRHGHSNEIIEVTKDVWVPISYRLFMAQMYGTVTSENTIKKALKSLIRKGFVLRRHDPVGRYDAPEYQLNVSLVQEEMTKLSKQGKGYQKLIPLENEGIKNSPPQELIPSGGQNLIPSNEVLSTEGSESGYQILIPNYIDTSYIDTKEESSPPATAEFHNLKRTIGDYTESELRKLSEQDLSTLLTSKQKEILGRWRSLLKAPVKLSGKVARALYDLEPYDPSAEMLEAIRRFCYTVDKKSDKFPQGYYHKVGVKLWDVVEHYADWLQTQSLPEPSHEPPRQEQKVTVGNKHLQPISALPRL